MSRGLTTLLRTEIAKSSVRMFHFIRFDFSTPIYTTDYFRNLTWDSKTWRPTKLLSFGSVSETTEIRVGTMNIVLSSVDQDNISVALTEDFLNDDIYIYRGFILDNSVVADPILIFKGKVDSFNIVENIGSGTSKLTWTAASHWADFQRISGRRTNNNEQIDRYANDVGFIFASEIIRDIKWGSA